MARPSNVRILQLALGALVLALVILHYGIDIGCWLSPACKEPWPVARRFSCLCPVAGLVVGWALLGRSRPMATLGVILWLVFALGATLGQALDPRAGWEWALAYQPVLAVAGVVTVATRLVDVREVPRMLGVTAILFGVKGWFQLSRDIWEMPAWFNLLFHPNPQRWSLPADDLAVLVGVILTIATWRLPRRGARPPAR